MNIKILGSGCKKCHKLEDNVKKTLENNNVTAEIEHVTEIEKIIAFGVMSTPALVINDKVVSSGKLLKEKEILGFLKDA